MRLLWLRLFLPHRPLQPQATLQQSEQTQQPGCTPMVKLDRRRPYIYIWISEIVWHNWNPTTWKVGVLCVWSRWEEGARVSQGSASDDQADDRWPAGQTQACAQKPDWPSADAVHDHCAGNGTVSLAHTFIQLSTRQHKCVVTVIHLLYITANHIAAEQCIQHSSCCHCITDLELWDRSVLHSLSKWPENCGN